MDKQGGGGGGAPGSDDSGGAGGGDGADDTGGPASVAPPDTVGREVTDPENAITGVQSIQQAAEAAAAAAEDEGDIFSDTPGVSERDIEALLEGGQDDGIDVTTDAGEALEEVTDRREINQGLLGETEVERDPEKIAAARDAYAEGEIDDLALGEELGEGFDVVSEDREKIPLAYTTEKVEEQYANNPMTIGEMEARMDLALATPDSEVIDVFGGGWNDEGEYDVYSLYMNNDSEAVVIPEIDRQEGTKDGDFIVAMNGDDNELMTVIPEDADGREIGIRGENNEVEILSMSDDAKVDVGGSGNTVVVNSIKGTPDLCVEGDDNEVRVATQGDGPDEITVDEGSVIIEGRVESDEITINRGSAIIEGTVESDEITIDDGELGVDGDMGMAHFGAHDASVAVRGNVTASSRMTMFDSECDVSGTLAVTAKDIQEYRDVLGMDNSTVNAGQVQLSAVEGGGETGMNSEATVYLNYARELDDSGSYSTRTPYRTTLQSFDSNGGSSLNVENDIVTDVDIKTVNNETKRETAVSVGGDVIGMSDSGIDFSAGEIHIGGNVESQDSVTLKGTKGGVGGDVEVGSIEVGSTRSLERWDSFERGFEIGGDITANSNVILKARDNTIGGSITATSVSSDGRVECEGSINTGSLRMKKRATINGDIVADGDYISFGTGVGDGLESFTVKGDVVHQTSSDRAQGISVSDGATVTIGGSATAPEITSKDQLKIDGTVTSGQILAHEGGQITVGDETSVETLRAFEHSTVTVEDDVKQSDVIRSAGGDVSINGDVEEVGAIVATDMGRPTGSVTINGEVESLTDHEDYSTIEATERSSINVDAIPPVDDVEIEDNASVTVDGEELDATGE